MGLQMESKMLPKLAQKISSKIVPFWLPSGPRHGAQEASKIALENHGKFDAILGAQIASFWIPFSAPKPFQIRAEF